MLKSSYTGNCMEAGCDEAGRGCLAGPVFAAAVVFPVDYQNPFLNDSKQLTLSQRVKLRSIIEKDALSWAVASVDNQVIDQVNILNASIQAMHLAIDQLKLRPELILVDGNRFHHYRDIPHRCIVKGDALFLSIAAASILAKTYRDDFMETLALTYPQYHWQKNKGYPTPGHRNAIQEFGLSPFHRLSFRQQKISELFSKAF